MADRRRAERRQARRRRPWHARPVGTVAGWVSSAADIEEGKRRTHDLLLELMGDRRRGGVSWIIQQDPEATRTLNRMTETAASTDHFEAYRAIKAKLREYGGWLIVATAPGDPPEGDA